MCIGANSLNHRPGISLLTQTLYCFVFLTRYLDLFTTSPGRSYYVFVFKIFYIASSFYILYLMLRRFPRTREGEREWRIAGWSTIGAVILAPIMEAISPFKQSLGHFTALGMFERFSLILESVAVLPQLTLLAHTSIPTAITSYYLIALGSYRALYIPNWIYRAADKNDQWTDPISITFGVIQTLLYIEFAWIYWRRQKVRLRTGGGVLDNEEFARGLVLGRLIGVEKKGGTRTGGGWRGQGLSVSADVDEFEVAGDDEDEIERELSGDESDHDVNDAERGLVRK